MLKLTDDQLEAFDPGENEWESAPPRLATFPEVDGRPMVFNREFYKRGDDLMVIEWTDTKRVKAVSRNGHWFEGDFDFERFQTLVREIVLNGETGEEFRARMFEFDLCAECAGDVLDHSVNPDMFGNWQALCTYKAPRMMQFVTTCNPARGNNRPVRLEYVDSGQIISERHASPARRDYSRQRLTYGSATGIPDEALSICAQEMLRDYRTKKHNEQ